MGTAKILGGVAFLVIGIVLFLIAFVPIPGLEAVCFTTLLLQYIDNIMMSMMSMDIAAMLGPSGYLTIAVIIPWVGYHYIKAGIKSMRYEKAKKQYFVTETKIGLMIAGFILICVAFAFIVLISFGVFTPYFDFLLPINPAIPTELSWIAMLLPRIIIPITLSILIIFFVYWIGSKIMKSGVKKEELF